MFILLNDEVNEKKIIIKKTMMFSYRLTHEDMMKKSEMKRFIIEVPYLSDVILIITFMLLYGKNQKPFRLQIDLSKFG